MTTVSVAHEVLIANLKKHLCDITITGTIVRKSPLKQSATGIACFFCVAQDRSEKVEVYAFRDAGVKFSNYFELGHTYTLHGIAIKPHQKMNSGTVSF